MKKPFVERANEFFDRARARAQRRKSPWNWISFPLIFGGFFATWYLLFRLVWTFHVWMYPTHEFHDFWGSNISFVSFALSFLMLFALFPSALCAGFLLANGVSWLIPPARRALEREVEGFPEEGFREATVGVLGIAAWTFPAGLTLSLVAASLLKSLR
jgi:hypothetical protein